MLAITVSAITEILIVMTLPFEILPNFTPVWWVSSPLTLQTRAN